MDVVSLLPRIALCSKTFRFGGNVRSVRNASSLQSTRTPLSCFKHKSVFNLIKPNFPSHLKQFHTSKVLRHDDDDHDHEHEEGEHYTFSIASVGEADTFELGSMIARDTKAGDIVLLEGSLGVGKTVFAKGFIQSRLGEATTVTSPTFVIDIEYKIPNETLTIHHFDLYRIRGTEEELSIIEFDKAIKDGICLVEWPDRIHPSMKPSEYLAVKIENSPEDLTPDNPDFPTISDESNKVEGDEDRVITLVAKGPKWIERLKEIERELE